MSSSLPQQAALSMDLNYSYTQTGTNMQTHTHTHTQNTASEKKLAFCFLSLPPILPSCLPPFNFFPSLVLWFTLALGRRREDQAQAPPPCSLSLSFFNLSFTQMLTHGYLPRSAHLPACVLCLLFHFLIIPLRPHHYFLKSDCG